MTYLEQYEAWLQSGALSEEESRELRSISGQEDELQSRFYGALEFGTAGLRGIMGIGLSRMNLHVIRHVTEAFALVILEEGAKAAERGVAICYDCRHQSADFARAAASVMVSHGIPVRMFEDMRPTPELSYAIRRYRCIAGINITASHNPKEYNGYKVYWEDGAQLPPKHAEKIAEKMKTLPLFGEKTYKSYEDSLRSGQIALMGAETDEAFLSEVMSESHNIPEVPRCAEDFRMVYTPFHGTGYRLIPEVLGRLGVRHLFCVPEQMIPDGSFSTVRSPNPEDPESFALALALAKEVRANFVLGSDPDADRVGILAKTPDGDYLPLTGNQTGVLLLDYLIRARKKAGTLPKNAAALKTIVTTHMAAEVAKKHGVDSFDTFTGFKFMAEKKNELEASGSHKVIFSYEESYGYMIGDYVRDKDAVTASLLLTEMAMWYHAQGLTLFDALERLYEQHGYFAERTINLLMPGLDGLARMDSLMRELRYTPPREIGGIAVAFRRDYQVGLETDIEQGTQKNLALGGSNVLSYLLADGTEVLVRPSGTEPKVKVYLLVRGASLAQCKEKLKRISAWGKSLTQ